MTLQHLEVRDFRCIARAELDFDNRCNLISGDNASGKTSLLEAIFFLGRGRSFRTPRNETLIRKGAHDLMVAGRLGIGASVRPVGIRYSRDGFDARAGGDRISSLAELAVTMPVQAIDPEVHRLVEEGPQERRRYLDWGVFHVEPSFVDHWRRYQRALKQRNAALRSAQPENAVRAWDPELLDAGRAVARYRREYFSKLQEFVAEMGRRLLGDPVELSLSEGWLAGTELADAVAGSWARDAERGTTHVGPHRADLAIRFEGDAARHRVSRGQQKLTAAAMLLGQLRCDAAQGSPTAALLVDDPAAELDSVNLERLMGQVLAMPAQLFVTALDRTNKAFEALPEGRTFHVEHGKLTPSAIIRRPPEPGIP
jgi:DNA replication and repair protein RecF